MLIERMRERGLGPLGLLLWGASLCAFLVLAGDGLALAVSPLCGKPSIAGDASTFALAAATVGLPALAGRLSLMAVAMMMPALSGPLLHIWHRSLTRHRWRGIGLFLASYLACWTLAGGVLMGVAAMLQGSARPVSASGLATVLAGLAWHASPARASCLARCHLRPRLSIFGMPAWWDPVRFGVTQAGWCIATCWALMLVPFLFDAIHLPLMAAGALVIARERLAPHGRTRAGALRRLARWAGPWATTQGPLR